MTIATVLRSGGVYDPEWVYALRAGVLKYLKIPHRFVCLTDMDVPGIDSYRLAHDFPGWWSKIELFTPGLFDGPVLYMDLDTLPVGWLLDLTTYHGPLAVLSDFYRPNETASGVMAWVPSERTESIYGAFVKAPAKIMANHRSRSDYWYRKVWGDPDRLQDLYPGQVVSLKAHAKDRPPDNARLVCGHGRPRLSSPKAGWAHEVWKQRAQLAEAA